jgi:hypothetical protein
MDQLLYKYLSLHKKLSIPQVGSFELQTDASHFDEQTGLLHGPVPRIVFRDGLIPSSEKDFYSFLATETVQEEFAVIKQFHDYAYTLRDTLQQQHWVQINGIGKLIRHTNGSHQFEPTHDLSEWMPSVVITSPVETVEEQEKKDLWWFYAIILAILGLGAMLYYYL